MFNNLIETNAKKQRSAGGTLMSLVLHSGLIVLVVVATASAGEQLPTEKPEQVDFIEPPRPEEPPPSEAAAALPPEVIAAPPLPKGFQVLQPPMDIPSVIPPIDLSKHAIREADFTARGVRGGTDDGHELFSKSVERALSEMRFVPAEVRGHKVKQLVQQPFVFDIR